MFPTWNIFFNHTNRIHVLPYLIQRLTPADKLGFHVIFTWETFTEIGKCGNMMSVSEIEGGTYDESDKDTYNVYACAMHGV